MQLYTVWIREKKFYFLTTLADCEVSKVEEICSRYPKKFPVSTSCEAIYDSLLKEISEAIGYSSPVYRASVNHVFRIS